MFSSPFSDPVAPQGSILALATILTPGRAFLHIGDHQYNEDRLALMVNWAEQSDEVKPDCFIEFIGLVDPMVDGVMIYYGVILQLVRSHAGWTAEIELFNRAPDEAPADFMAMVDLNAGVGQIENLPD